MCVYELVEIMHTCISTEAKWDHPKYNLAFIINSDVSVETRKQSEQ